MSRSLPVNEFFSPFGRTEERRPGADRPVDRLAPAGLFHASRRRIDPTRRRPHGIDRRIPRCRPARPEWPVIECRDGEQWILQRRSNKWEGRSYCRTAEALRRVVREHVGDVDLNRKEEDSPPPPRASYSNERV